MTLQLPALVVSQQAKASNPEVSVWVSANAGSGKTHVLAQRVLRLLLAGVAPAKILCLTFTKAAAANMAAKIFAALSQWTELDDEALRRAILAIGAPQPSAEMLTFARRLFARTVETPGGLKVHTIHGFCERLLHLFPFEANVPARFEVMDEIGEAELLREARRQALAAARTDVGELGGALQRLSAETSQKQFDQLIAEATQHRALLRHYDIKDATADLGCALDLAPGTTLATVEAEMIEAGIPPRRWREFAEFLAEGSKSDCDNAALLRAAQASYNSVLGGAGMTNAARAACLSPYLDFFFTQKGGPRVRLATDALSKLRPELAEELSREQARLDTLRERCKAAECFERSRALMSVIAAVFARYENLKGARGLLDFDDLIERTLALLDRSDARWVLFKLDSGIDHILVDEAQDTSPTQWKILEALTAEFFAGAGSRTYPRTFFAVGDEKQSIFSFQGAAPQMFHEMRTSFARSSGGGFEHVLLKHSFRSVPAVLATVDQIFLRTAHQKGLVSDDIWMGHESLKRDLPGLIEVWPPVCVEARADPRDWRLPLDFLDEGDPAAILADRIARKIAALIAPGAGECTHEAGGRRTIKPGDILILVRTRNAFFEAVIRALKRHDVPVAGADRLDLLSHIAVMDLMAAGRAALLPQDDLTLAAVLKSPLLGLDDEDLLEIAPARCGSLFDALGASLEARHQTPYATILGWRERAALSPFDFYARLLGEEGGRRALQARLGPEACDAIDEFLRLALRAESEGSFSLAGFLAGLEGIDLSIKRDMETASDCVRVMTIHAAKGLEAKIVFLPDTCGVPSGRHDNKIHVLEASGAHVLAWSPRKDADPQAVAAARQKARAEAEDEHRRLLYVALTRAEERLYISGYRGSTEPGEPAWSRMIEDSLDENFAAVPAFWDEGETIRRWCAPGNFAGETAAAEERVAEPIDLPGFLTCPASPEAAPPPPLKPSSVLAAADSVEPQSARALPGAALERGRLMHVLLQHLPEVPAQRRRAAAQAFLDARATDLPLVEREALIAETLAVLENPTLADLFGSRARAEVAVVGRIAGPDGQMREISGQVDRIVETEGEVIVADYKTGAPCDVAATPHAYLAQMALYRAVLAPLWPGKRLRMLIIWTAGPKVVELADAQLDASLATVFGQD
ncbi:MAG: double-strand break repair helicase AddA [Methylovirgula sp.]